MMTSSPTAEKHGVMKGIQDSLHFEGLLSDGI